MGKQKRAVKFIHQDENLLLLVLATRRLILTLNHIVFVDVKRTGQAAVKVKLMRAEQETKTDCLLELKRD